MQHGLSCLLGEREADNASGNIRECASCSDLTHSLELGKYKSKAYTLKAGKLREDNALESLRDKTILVTGGTGFIGKPLCQALVYHGARVFVLTRSVPSRNRDTITYISSISDMKETEPNIIINLAGESIAQKWTPSAQEKIRESRIGITSSIVDYIKSSTKKPSLLISASAVGFYGTHENTEFDETTAPSTAGGRFSRELCAAWEAEALKAEKYGVRTVLLRNGAVLGKDGGMLGKLTPLFRLGLGGPIGHGRQWLSWIDRDDLVNLILHIICSPSVKGPINATAPNPLSNEDFSKTLAEILGRPCLFRTPALALRLVFGGMADEIMLQGQKVLPRKAIESGFIFSCPSLAISLQKIFKVEKK